MLSPRARLAPLLGLILALALTAASAREIRIPCDLDPFLDIPACFGSMTPDALEKVFPPHKNDGKGENIYFSWLTSDRTRAYFLRRPHPVINIDLRLFGGKVKAEEAVIDFEEDGRFLGATFSLYNRGDGGTISPDEFKKRYLTAGKAMGERLAVRPFTKKAIPAQGLLTEGYTWISERGMAILEYNPEAFNGQPEFLRLRVMRRDAKGPLAASMRARSGSTVRLSELPRNVVEDKDGTVRIKGIPMVDQGPKGYCVVASTQRVFEYYGIPCDMHQLAQISGSDAARGTNTVEMAEGLQKIVHRFKTRFKVLCLLFYDGRLHEVDRDLNGKGTFGMKDFSKDIRSSIDDGIPILWSLQLGRFPEEPAIALQARGGHMRLITGYNDKTGHIIFSDSWGAGHERKRMREMDAFRATTGLFSLQPTTR